MALLPLPDGSAVKIREGETPDQAWARALQMYPEAFGIQRKHGFIEATKAGAKQGIGSGLRGLGSFTGSDRLEAAGQAMLAPDQTPGAYRETTDEDVDAAYKQSFLSGLGSQFSKHISEPLGGMIGRYAVPTAVGTAAGAIAAPFAPDLAIAGIGAGALGEAAGFIASDAPMEQGENIGRQEEVTKQREEQGLAPLPYNQTETVAASLASAALMPVFGGVGGKLFAPLIKIMGPELATTAKMVERGEMTQADAVAQLNKTATNLLIKSGETAAIGAPMMVGTEALRRGQAGQDVTGPEAQAAYGENLKAALAFAPIGGVIGGARARAGQTKLLEGAGEVYRKKAAAEQAAQDIIDKRAAVLQATPEGETAPLGLNEPSQPKGGAAAYEKQQATYVPEGVENVLDSGYFNRLGIANKGDGKELRKQFAGLSLDHPEVAAELKLALEAHAEAHPEKATAIEAALKDPMFYEQQDFGFPSLEEQQAAWQAAQYAAEAARTKQKSAETRASKEVGQTPGAGGTRDMFSGAEANRVRPEVELPPAKTAKQFEAQNQSLYADFEAANEHYQKTGDDAALNAILSKAKEQLGPMQEKRNQESTAPLFDKEGRPTNEAAIRETEKTAEPIQPADRGESDVLPVSGAARAEPASLGVEPERMGTSVRADEHPAVAEKPEPVALKPEAQTTQQQIDALAGKTGIKAIARRKKLLAQRAAEQQAVARSQGFKGLELTEAEKRADAKARAAKGADEALIEDTATGIGRAGKATSIEEFAPTQYKLNSPEHLDADGSVNPGMASLWWNDLAQMYHDAKHGTPAEKILAQKAIKVGLKAENFDQAQLERATTVDQKNIAALRKHGRKTILERVRAEIAENKDIERQARSHKAELAAAKKAIVEGEKAEAERVKKEQQAEKDAARHVTDSGELETTTLGEAGFDPDAFMYRRGIKSEASHTKAEAELMVKNIKEKWTNAPKIKVRNLDELDAEPRAWVEKHKAKGFIDDKTGEVVIVSDRNADLHDVKATILHEALGHYGLRSKFREGLSKLMQDMYTSNPEFRAEADKFMKRTGVREPARAMEEMLAERAEKQLTGPVEQKLLSRVRAWIQNFLREHGVNVAFNEHDIRAILRQAHEEVVSGKKTEAPVGGERAARTEKEPKFSDDIPAKTRVTLEHEGPDGEPVIAEVSAKTEMRAVERRMAVLEKLLECVANA